MLTNPITLILLAFFIFFVCLGISYSTNNTSEFHTFKRETNPIRLIASLFSIIGASEFVIFGALIFVFGIQSILFFVGTFIGFLILSFNAGKIRQNAAAKDQHSIPNFAKQRGYHNYSLLLAIVSWAFTFTLMLMQVIIGGELVYRITDISYELSAFLVAAATALYLVFGGYKALLNTDVIQATMIFLLTLALSIWALTTTIDLSDITFKDSVPVPDVVVFGIGGIFAIAGGPEIWQRILTARTAKAARASLVASGLTMLIWGFGLVLFSLAIQTSMPDADPPDTAFIDFVVNELPPIIVGFVAVLLIAAMLSTADTELFAGSVIIADTIRGRSREPLSVNRTRIIIIVTSALAYIVAISTPNLLNIYLALVYLSFITGPAAFALMLNRGFGYLFWVTTILALGVLVFLFITDQLKSWYPVLILVIASIPLALPSKTDS